jgi:hypothetical protein
VDEKFEADSALMTAGEIVGLVLKLDASSWAALAERPGLRDDYAATIRLIAELRGKLDAAAGPD